MRQISILSIFYFIFTISNIHATKAMAEKEKMSCVQCHKTSRGGRKGKPNLKSQGIKYIKKLVEKEGYVPKSRIRQLTFLAAKIKANKLKIDSKAREAQDKIDQEKAARQKALEEETRKAELAKKQEEDRIQAEIKQKIQEEIKKKAQEQLIEAEKVDSVAMQANNPKQAEKRKKSLNNIRKNEVQSSSMVRGPKTVILKRKNVGPKSYDALTDWEFDDYF